MDFYEDFYNERRKKPKAGSIILTALISAIIGGLLVLMLLPALVNNGIIDLKLQDNDTSQNGQALNVMKQTGNQITVDINSGIVNAVQKVKPAVVGVINIQKQNNLLTRQTTNVDAGEGSGVIFDKKDGKAYIVTNYHVIQGANNVEVALPEGDRIEAELLGYDELMDLAVIAIDQKYVDTVAPLGDSTNLNPGEPAIAIGNPLGTDFSQTVTVGVISSTNRTISKDLTGDGIADLETEVIQTDAAINPGNSGGALVNIEGYVIGINSAKIAETGVEGLGFAIPISDAKPIIDQLIKYGKVKRAYMGITPYDLRYVSQQDRTNVLKLPNSVSEGIVLNEVSKFGAAAMAGLERFDVVVKLDDQEINSSADLRKYLYKYKKVGDKMKVTYYREGKLTSTIMTLTERPDSEN